MGILGKFWNGIRKGWDWTKDKLGVAGQWIKENHEPLEKILGSALGAGANYYTGGLAAPFINGAKDLIENLPDNEWTKHLKNIAKGAAFDYSQKEPEQTNAPTEFRAPPLHRLTPPSSASPPSPIVRRAVGPPKVKRALTHTPLNSILELVKTQRIIPKTIKRNKTKGKKKSKSKKTKGK